MHINRTYAMHVNQSLLGQVVFTVVDFRLNASVKSLPLLDCRRWSSSSHADTMRHTDAVITR